MKFSYSSPLPWKLLQILANFSLHRCLQTIDTKGERWTNACAFGALSKPPNRCVVCLKMTGPQTQHVFGSQEQHSSQFELRGCCWFSWVRRLLRRSSLMRRRHFVGFAANLLIATLGVVFTTKALKQDIRNQQSSEGLFRRPSLPIGSKLQSMWQAPKLTICQYWEKEDWPSFCRASWMVKGANGGN